VCGGSASVVLVHMRVLGVTTFRLVERGLNRSVAVQRDGKYEQAMLEFTKSVWQPTFSRFLKSSHMTKVMARLQKAGMGSQAQSVMETTKKNLPKDADDWVNIFIMAAETFPECIVISDMTNTQCAHDLHQPRALSGDWVLIRGGMRPQLPFPPGARNRARVDSSDPKHALQGPGLPR